MDSERSSEKTRYRRKSSSILKLDHLSLTDPTVKFDDWLLPTNLNPKKTPVAADSDLKHWALVTEGFPPGITVDDIKFYGRRKQLAHLKPQDNLRVEEGNVKPYVTEYKRRYQVHGPLYLKPLQEASGKDVPTLEFIKNDPNFQKRCDLKRPPNYLEPMKIEKSSQCSAYPLCERRKLLRRMTALKTEGEMTNETEVRREYKAYVNPERAQIIRRLPSLKIEGDFEPMITEQQEKYTPFLVSKRPIMEKKKTLLKMEGDFDFSTENFLSYVPHKLQERPRIRKRSTSLKLDGELEFSPEYRESFVDFQRCRPITYKPKSTMVQEGGELERHTETKTQFVNYDRVSVPESAKPKNHLLLEGEMKIAPEYKVSYVDFPRERPFTKRPLSQIKPEGHLRVLSENFQKIPEPSSVEKFETIKQTEETTDFTSEKKDETKNNETELFKTTSSLLTAEKASEIRCPVDIKEELERRPSSHKLQGEFLFAPEHLKSFGNVKTPLSPLKPVRTFKSTPSSPRKMPKERIKFNLEDKKFILGTPGKKSGGSRRGDENSRPLDSNVAFDLLHKSKTETEQDMSFHTKDKTGMRGPTKLDPHFGKTTTILNPIQPKEFQAFHVLDVKGQQGCQTLRKDPLDGDKTTSEDEYYTYRLEVSNPEKPEFQWRRFDVFHPSAKTAVHAREEAEKRARKRSEFYEKIVKSPKMPNYLFGENNGNQVPEKFWKSSGKVSPLYPIENPSGISFTVLEDKGNGRQTSKDGVGKGEKADWAMPGWMNSAPIA